MSGSHHASEGRCKVGSVRSGKGVVEWGEHVWRGRKWGDARDPHQICTRFAPDLHQICTRFARDPHEIRTRSAPNLEPVFCTSFN